MRIAWIPFKTWESWTNEERAQFELDCESRGVRWAIDLRDVDPQKDADEHREDVSLGGERYDPFKP